MSEGVPSRRRKVLFWAILGMLSTFIAEVTVGSAPFPFFDPFGILVVVPLYTLHIIVLGTFVVRGRRVTLNTLFVAGIIFGLYEAYITKVIWDPYWEFGTTVYVADVAVIQTALLILWYHNFFAFIIPLAVAEMCCASSRKIFSALPQFVRDRFGDDRIFKTLVLMAVAFGMLQAASAHGPLVSLASVGGSGLLVFALCWVFQSTGNGVRYPIDSLLPDPKEFRVFVALLLMFYAVFTALLLPENLPGPPGHVAVLLMYLGAFLLLRSLLRLTGTEGSPGPEGGAVSLTRDRASLFLAVYAFVAAAMGFVPVLAGIVTICIHIAGVSIGVVLLTRAVKSCIRLN